MVTKHIFQALFPYVSEIVQFTNSLTDENNPDWELFNYLESLDYKFENLNDFRMTVQTLVYYDLLNCYFALGYHQIYNRDDYVLFDLVEYAFYLGHVKFSHDEFERFISVPKNASFFKECFNITKHSIKSIFFPALYIKLNEIEKSKSNEYISILQMIMIKLSENIIHPKSKNNTLISTLLSNPQSFLNDLDEDDEFQQRELDYSDNKIDKDETVTNYVKNELNMELLKDKLFNGISLEIIKEEYIDGLSFPFKLYLRISNYNDHKKKIGVDIKYISTKHGLKTRGGLFGEFIPDNSFVDLDIGFEDITGAFNGDRIELDLNEGKFASLRLLRERGQWTIVESIERSAYNKELKSKIEHFEAIDEQFGITLQNFSVKVEDENTLKVFCEVLALNGEIPENDFTINIAIYDNNNEIVYTDSESKYAEDFKGFEVLTFDYIKLDITVDEISKIRIYPTR